MLKSSHETEFSHKHSLLCTNEAPVANLSSFYAPILLISVQSWKKSRTHFAFLQCNILSVKSSWISTYTEGNLKKSTDEYLREMANFKFNYKFSIHCNMTHSASFSARCRPPVSLYQSQKSKFFFHVVRNMMTVFS